MLIFIVLVSTILICTLLVYIWNEQRIKNNLDTTNHMYSIKTAIMKDPSIVHNLSALQPFHIAICDDKFSIESTSSSVLTQELLDAHSSFKKKLITRSKTGGACFIAPWKHNLEHQLKPVTFLSFYVPKIEKHVILIHS